ncbi:MAG: GWxTD domain-containing protein [Bacteroidota bacterium]
MSLTWWVIPWLGALALVLAACSAPDRLDDVDAGRTLVYDPDEPVFDLDARLLLAEHVESGVESDVDSAKTVPLQALVAVEPSTLVAEADGVEEERVRVRYQLSVLVRIAGTRTTVREQLWADTLSASTADGLRSLTTAMHEARFALAPGLYLVEARLDDLSTQREAVRQLRIEVPDTSAPDWNTEVRVGRLQLERKNGDGYAPYLGRTLATSPESLRVRATVVTGTDLPVTLHVERLPSDTTVARPPHWLGPQRGSLAYQGVRMRDGVVVARREAVHAGGAADHVLMVPPMTPGLYKIAVSIGEPEGLGAVSARYLTVLDAGHPRMETMDGLIESLAFMAYERERAFILEAEAPEERRARFDAFWGALLGDRRVAANVLRLYYERVEDANRRFSTVKAGWKTDRGMLYVLLGPPAYVELDPMGETWYYGSGLRQDATAFSFRRVDDFGQPAGWQPYVLQRQAAYEAVWARALRQWRTGRAG